MLLGERQQIHGRATTLAGHLVRKIGSGRAAVVLRDGGRINLNGNRRRMQLRPMRILARVRGRLVVVVVLALAGWKRTVRGMQLGLL